MKTVICPGSFDPVTLGHIDIIERASGLFDHVIVAVLCNFDKKHPCFSVEERMAFLHETTAQYKNVEIDSFSGLLVDYARKRNANAVVKGLRAISDFEYEFQMSMINKKLYRELETVYLNTSQEYMYLSSSVVRQIASLGGDISNFVPAQIHDKIVDRLINM